jgi:hypothetical protein
MDTGYTDAMIRHATDCADGDVVVMSARPATRREIAASLRAWYPSVRVSRREMTRVLDRAARREWRDGQRESGGDA